MATASSDNDVRFWDLSEGKLLAPPLTHPQRVEDVTMMSDFRILVCSHFAATVWTYRPAVSSEEDILQFSRLLTAQSLNAMGETQTDVLEVVENWGEVKKNNPQFVAASQHQIFDWYNRLLNHYSNSRA